MYVAIVISSHSTGGLEKRKTASISWLTQMRDVLKSVKAAFLMYRLRQMQGRDSGRTSLLLLPR